MKASLIWSVLLLALSPLCAGAAQGSFEAITATVDRPADLYAVPFFLVDRNDPAGTTTLYAVRNTSDAAVDLGIEYFTTGAALIREDEVTLEARETLTVNVRDVDGLPVDPDGFSRGFVRLTVVRAPATENLTGDFLQVDVDDDFATGDRLITVDDLCELSEVRFLDLGSGTRLRIFVNEPQGADPESDPPSFTVSVLDESGQESAPQEVFTDRVVVESSAAEFTDETFGTLVFDFTHSGGYVYAEYSAEGRFSVGVNSACRSP